jgi:hypothetical protein
MRTADRVLRLQKELLELVEVNSAKGILWIADLKTNKVSDAGVQSILWDN